MKTLTIFTFWSFCLVGMLYANPETNDPNPKSLSSYTDYQPNYRTMSKEYLITHIEHAPKKSVLHFRYVVGKDQENISFYGQKMRYAWIVSTSARQTPNSLEAETEVKNIRINNQPKQNQIDEWEVTTFTANRGDIVSCEIHFKHLPVNMKYLHLIGGTVNQKGYQRFVSNYILMKKSDDPNLGNESNMIQEIKTYYDERGKVKHPEIIKMNSLEQDRLFAQSKNERKAKAEEISPIHTSSDKVDYMPKMLESVDDLVCNERVILKNVFFKENKADYAGRVKAMQSIGLVVEYLEQHPNSKIILHGHTDIFGDPVMTLQLSKNRVLTIKRSLVRKGIKEDRIILLFYGGKQPLPLYKEGGEMNRRVEVEAICAE